MEFKVIPYEQTPEIRPRHEDINIYIDNQREELLAFLEFARSKSNAVGLAANQVAMFAGEADDEDGIRFAYRAFALGGRARNWRLIIDPVITKTLGLQQCKAEGCLTWVGKVIVADRYEAVEVSYYDMDGTFHEGEIYKGFDAQIWQHEINHLNGIEEDVRDNFVEPPPIIVGRNDPCPCGSGKKYKKCCLLF